MLLLQPILLCTTVTGFQHINSAVSRKLIAKTPLSQTPDIPILDGCMFPSPLVDPMNHEGGDMLVKQSSKVTL